MTLSAALPLHSRDDIASHSSFWRSLASRPLQSNLRGPNRRPLHPPHRPFNPPGFRGLHHPHPRTPHVLRCQSEKKDTFAPLPLENLPRLRRNLKKLQKRRLSEA